MFALRGAFAWDAFLTDSLLLLYKQSVITNNKTFTHPGSLGKWSTSLHQPHTSLNSLPWNNFLPSNNYAPHCKSTAGSKCLGVRVGSYSSSCVVAAFLQGKRGSYHSLWQLISSDWSGCYVTKLKAFKMLSLTVWKFPRKKEHSTHTHTHTEVWLSTAGWHQ